jgi:parallel beta-helix repeat protein
MHRIRIMALLLAAISTTALTTQAHAVQRTHVSAAIGNDTNTATGCTPVAPCRTFQAAMTVTDPNGEVVVLDSGGYGAVGITQSVALIAPTGVFAGISVFANIDAGISIAEQGINVVLRGLTINGQGGNFGIHMEGNNKLTIENCVISNLEGSGIFVEGTSTVRITNTIIRDNGFIGVHFLDGARGTITRSIISGNVDAGVFAQGVTNGTTTTVDIAKSTISGNAAGVGTGNSSNAVNKISIRDSRIVRNINAGLSADGGAGTAILSASNNIVSNNGIGIMASGIGAKVWASGNTVSDSETTGLQNANGAVFETAGNNAVRNNAPDFKGTIKSSGSK